MKLNYEDLEALGLTNEGNIFSWQVGNNLDLVINKDLLISLRLNWGEGDGVHTWSKIDTVEEFMMLIKLLGGDSPYERFLKTK